MSLYIILNQCNNKITVEPVLHKSIAKWQNIKTIVFESLNW